MRFYTYYERRTPREKERIQSPADNLVYSAEHLRNGSVWRIDTGTNNLDLVMVLLKRDGSTWLHFRTVFVRTGIRVSCVIMRGSGAAWGEDAQDTRDGGGDENS
jgi:hypothetical protein